MGKELSDLAIFLGSSIGSLTTISYSIIYTVEKFIKKMENYGMKRRNTKYDTKLQA